MRFHPAAKRRRDLRPSLEHLEQRQVLSAAGIYSANAHLDKWLASTASKAGTSFISLLPTKPTTSISTIPANGDLNPYGVARVPRGFLVTNFNDSKNVQGTGTTIQKIFLNGTSKTWFQAPKGFGLTDAIGVLTAGFVFVGSVPTTDGTAATIKQGSVLVLNRYGKEIANLKNSKLLDGPWGMAVNDHGDNAQVFISNVLNGTITRLNVVIKNGKPDITSAVRIAQGYKTEPNAAAVVLGPTGLAYNYSTGVLYVASTADNAIYAIPNASSLRGPVNKGVTIVRNNPNLRGPIGLTFAPNADLLVTNGDAVNADAADPSELLEFRPNGTFVGSLSLDPAQGAAFGLVVKKIGNQYWLATVNDDTNKLDIRVVS
jgi:hypothetical protein